MLGYPVASVKEIFEDPQHAARDFWQEIHHPELGCSITYPGGFAKLSEGACRVRRRAPQIGEHNEEVYCGEMGMTKTELNKLKREGII
jgi:crotonobetainyl-CoA:carnitine CoA-transferase CaiB-like acyl-CoA transferase